MPKPFSESFNEWVEDARYVIGEDIGWEFSDDKEAGPMPVDSSLAPNHVTTHSEQEIID